MYCQHAQHPVDGEEDDGDVFCLMDPVDGLRVADCVMTDGVGPWLTDGMVTFVWRMPTLGREQKRSFLT